MTVCDDCFWEFLHPLIHEAMETNDRFSNKYGSHARWDWDCENSILTFSDPEKPTLQIDASIVGTTEGNSWQWAWANGNHPTITKIGIEKVREFGETHGYEKLTSAFLDADEYTGWEMTAVAVKILDAPGSYRFPTADGFCYLVYRRIQELSPASLD